MKENIYSDFYKDDGSKIDYKALVFEYLLHWPFILTSLLVFLAGAYIYLRYQPPVYTVTSSLLIKQGDNAASSPSSSWGSMQGLGMFSMVNNFDNEIEILKSYTLMRKVVGALDLYIHYAEDQPFRYPAELYKEAPVQLWMAPDEAERLTSPLRVRLNCQPSGGIEAVATYHMNDGEHTVSKSFSSLPAVFITPVGTLSLSAARDSAKSRLAAPRTLQVTVESPSSAAAACRNRLVAEPASESTSIVLLSYDDTHTGRATDVLNTLVTLYNNDANEDKNQVASRTAQFIDERIRIINGELGTTESELAEYKQRAGLTNLSTDAQLALQSNAEYNRKRAENDTQLHLIDFLRSYIEDPANHYEVIPANVGITDAGLVNVISQYNEMLIERKRLLRTSNERNPAVINLDTSIAATRNTVITTVESVEKALQITRHNLDLEARKYQSRVSNAPRQERDLVSITRQQEIKANLYLMLLQKREENALTLAATANNGRVIEEPRSNGVPVSPHRINIYLVSILLGVFFPVGSIYLTRSLRFKIEGRADVQRITDIPIIGDIPFVKEVTAHSLVVSENKNGLMEEVFRNVRTNLQYTLQEGQKVILFTSTTPGEGKSFTAANLAASFAFMGARTLIVGMDIRKPVLGKLFALPGKPEGITRYLAAPASTDLLSLCQPSSVSPHLYVLPSGIIPPNPTELVARPALEEAFALLRQHFDYIIVDSAPIGMVTDTRLIARVADACVYVCRAGFTRKTDYALINEWKQDQKLPTLCTLINGIDMDKRRNGYYYGYGKYGKYGKYGYGKKYGYGYGYRHEN